MTLYSSMDMINTRKTFIFFLSFCLMFILQPACYYDNEEDLYGTNPNICDTVSVKFSTIIQPLLDSNCTTCHSPSGSEPSILLDSYTNIRKYVANNRLLERTNDSNSPMPPTGLLDVCNRNKIKAWINAGAPNN